MKYELRRKNEEKIIPYVWINGDAQAEEIQVQLMADGTRVQIVGIFLGTINKSVVFNTKVIHTGKNTFSRTDIRGVFFGSSSISNDGLITIQKGSKGADGYFTSKILLFDNAKGRSVPSLEIDENELKAGHASTIGRPDENQILYMRSRGIVEKDAEKLIVSGFFESVLQLLPQKQKKEIQEQIQKSL